MLVGMDGGGQRQDEGPYYEDHKGQGEKHRTVVVPRTASEAQRLRLEKLMRQPERPVVIPERMKEWTPKAPPEFVRDIMGSSAGAGSGEFHVYRHIRRREYVRQDYLDRQAEKGFKDQEFRESLEKNREKGLQRTARKRAKRAKLKAKKAADRLAKKSKKAGEQCEEKVGEELAESDEDEEEEEEEETVADDAEEVSFVMGGR
uniref:PRKR-interacting protein 1 isoform X1 n=2 Tax=Myxine glutinosa TaxID=7769 RepID=UPI00358E2782